MKYLKRLFNLPMLFLGVGIIFELIALLIYYATGINEFNDSLSPLCLGFSYATLIFGILLVVLRTTGFDNYKKMNGLFDVLVISDYLLALASFMFFVISKVNYIANILVSIDGTKISLSFVMTALLFLLSFAMILVAGVLSKKLVAKKEA